MKKLAAAALAVVAFAGCARAEKLTPQEAYDRAWHKCRFDYMDTYGSKYNSVASEAFAYCSIALADMEGSPSRR